LDSHFIPQAGIVIWGSTVLLTLFCLFFQDWWTKIIWIGIAGFAAFLLFFVTPTFGLVDQVRQAPLREIASVIQTQTKSGERIMMIGFKKPSIVFYSGHPVGYFWSLDEKTAQEYLQKLPKDAAPTLLLLGQPTEIAQNGLNKNDYQILAQKDPYLLVRVDREKLKRN